MDGLRRIHAGGQAVSSFSIEGVKIGDPVWVFDINHRVYRKGPDGRSLGGGPIWREHWVRKEITGETSRSWVVGRGGYDTLKIPKKGPVSLNICFSEEEIDRRAFCEENAHRISDKVLRCRDYETLKKIADLLQYTPL